VPPEGPGANYNVTKFGISSISCTGWQAIAISMEAAKVMDRARDRHRKAETRLPVFGICRGSVSEANRARPEGRAQQCLAIGTMIFRDIGHVRG
jgi:hypothetical protein